MEWMFLPLKRYADFQGRSRRMEYWMFQLLLVVVNLVFWVMMAVGIIISISNGQMDDNGPSALFWLGLALYVLFSLAILVPLLAAQVRRFHDQNLSGWFVLLSFVPAGGFVILVFMCLPGTVGPNQYGADPLRQ